MKNEVFSYSDGVDTFIGYLAWNEEDPEPKPGVLIAPAFGGISGFERAVADDLAELGYVALAVDYYGNGTRVETPEEARALMAGVTADRRVLVRRMAAARDAIGGLSHVDASRIGAMGYCLGGKAVLDLARSGAALRACVSVHGVYDAPNFATQEMQPAVLVLHGWDDPLAPPTALQQLAQELTDHCADWQVLSFGHTGHAFTNPNAKNVSGGMHYSAKATARSWSAILGFFDETLGGNTHA
ncbi:dienelactone hydrolase family protein [Phaeobacter sp. B1627]|uniref:dienelactone hydrolase family protein n=1 Tax=Phaeobacter sp. B1627 TaxID=2583809 RepID=UPI00111AF6C6|nr:dienelactone hydrolase family protein [Phaeobacter sp. B1627]TNJ43932.1 dienelactone hydrolase family protein [Phaeobacter sp. B1627]